MRCTGGGPALFTPVDAITVGVWQHVACTYDRLNMRAYLNGVERASQPATAAIATGDTTGTALGTDSPPPADRFDGLIDDLRLWSVPRSQPEICLAAGGGGR